MQLGRQVDGYETVDEKMAKGKVSHAFRTQLQIASEKRGEKQI